jgi:hypothetical protein
MLIDYVTTINFFSLKINFLREKKLYTVYCYSVRFRAMSDAEIKAKALIDELQNWCREKYGRNTEAAEALGVSRQLISDWFSGRTVPSLVMGFKIQEFLKQQRPRRKKT